jgi:L-ascorbate metabolism protein UlaG (beta-lactamase superfamily)
MIKPLQQNEVLVADIQAQKNKKGLHIWWLGQSGFLLHLDAGACVLFDPYLSDSLPKKYANTNKPHERVSEIVVDPALLFNIDVVTSSHNHTDHLDAETLQPILKNNPSTRFIIPEANRQFVVDRIACELDFPIGMNDGLELKVNDLITIYGLPAAHNNLDRDEFGQCKYMSFVVKIGDFTVYHSGDTLLYDGLIDLLKPFKVDVAFLPINGNDPSRGVAGNLNAEEAAFVAKEIGAKLTIPHHYDMFKFNTANPKDFELACQRQVLIIKCLS